MRNLRLAMCVAAMILAAVPAAAQSYSFAAEHEHTVRACRGTLVISPDGIEYKTEHAKDARVWQYRDLRQIKVESPTVIELTSYEDQRHQLGRDRIFKFKLLGGEITTEISALLTAKATRPLAMSINPFSKDMANGAPAFEVPVKHLHRFGGCEGVLKIYASHLSYESRDDPGDSRHWRFSDVQSFSQSERFRLEIATYEEDFGGPKSYNFQLKGDLPAKAYDYLWARVYPSKFHREDRPSNTIAKPAQP